MEYTLTESHIVAIHYAHITGSSLSLFLCLSVCLASLWIYSVPSARNHLDRVSFRLLLWSMGVEVVYNVVFLVGTNDTTLINRPLDCAATAYLLLATMGVANWLCTTIGLNLMLAITFDINPLQAKLERWYVSLSVVLGFGVPLVPAILGHFGKDPAYDLCYFTQGNKALRMRDFIVDLYFWQLLSCLIAAVSVVTVLITLLRQSRATERALFRSNKLTITSSELDDITSTNVDTRFPFRKRKSHMNRLDDKLTTIALKISLYPLALLFINVIITAEDLGYTSRGGIFNEVQYGIYWTHNFLYAGRGIFFALLGIFVDPCLRLGLPAAWNTTPRRPPGTYTEDQSIAEFLSTTGPEEIPYLLASLGGPVKGILKQDVEKGTEDGTPGLDVSIATLDFPSSLLPDIPPPARTAPSRTHDWLEPLAHAVMAQSQSRSDSIRRRGSDPALGVAQRRRRELQAAAEEMYAQAAMKL